MISVDIAQKVKELELHTRRLLQGSRIGGSKSRQKGFGFEFDQLRAYQYGDDVRLIDWKSSARSADGLYVRQYFEERNRTIMICLDLSASTMFGSTHYLKQDIMKQIAGVLALAGQYCQDKVGLILFSDRIEKVIPPAKGHKHVHELLNQMFGHQAIGVQTDFNVLADYVAARVPKRCMVLMVSDFIGVDPSVVLKKIIFDKEVIAFTCRDPQEEMLTNVGYVWMKDPETGSIELVNSSGACGRRLKQGLQAYAAQQSLAWRSSNVDTVCLQNQATFMHDLLMFFQKRMI